jgi:hypothetical protein
VDLDRERIEGEVQSKADQGLDRGGGLTGELQRFLGSVSD